MVLLRDDAKVSVADIQRELASNWPDLEITEAEEKDGSLSITFGETFVIFSRMPAPFPWSDLEGPCATSVLWKNAAAEIKPHKFHWVVVVNGELDPIELSTMLTQATASFMAVCPTAIGVYWGNATLIVPKNLFIDFAKDVMSLGPPLHIWVDFRVGRDGEHTSSGFTAGMKALGHMELEAQKSPEPPGELHERLMSLARYVVENGPVIRDGDTIGEDENERIRVIYSKSAFGHKDQVMRLEYEQSSPKKPWWKLW